MAQNGLAFGAVSPQPGFGTVLTPGRSSTADVLLRLKLAELSKESPEQFAKQLKAMAREAFDPLKLKMGAVNLFLASTKKRLRHREISKTAYSAEIAVASTAVSLYDSLRRMRAKAEKPKNIDHLLAVNLAACALSNRFDDKNLLLPRDYPEQDPQLLGSMVGQRRLAAVALHRKISGMLEGAPEALGISLPKAPEA